MYNWSLDEYSKSVTEELQSFLPDRLFDAHAHTGLKADLDVENFSIFKDMPETFGAAAWRDFTSRIMGQKRLSGGLFFALPLFRENASIRQTCISANRTTVEDLLYSKEKKSRANLLVSKKMNPGDVEPYLKDNSIAGFKPYTTLCPGCSVNSGISDFVPEWSLQLAHENELAVTLHIQKYAALNDPDNIKQVHDICKKYSKLKLILAHCGCSFNVYNTLEGAKYYTDLDNIYFDTSAVCEGMALTHMLKLFDPSKFMWGTDFPISVRKGRFVGLGNYVFSLQDNTVMGGSLPKNVKTLNHGIESLRALIYAIKEAKLCDKEIEGIFYGNAAGLLEI